VDLVSPERASRRSPLGFASRLPANLRAVDVARRAGLLDPGLSAANAAAVGRWGPTMVVPFVAGALRYPDRTAVIDPERRWTYGELDASTDRIATRLRSGAGRRGVDRVGVLAGNTGWFVVAVLAAAKTGADVVLLNTGFAGPQLAEVIDREGIDVVLHDEDLRPPEVPTARKVWWVPTRSTREPDLSVLDRQGRRGRVAPPRRAGGPILLTSGTTGTPKGARRQKARPDLAVATGLLERVPLRRGDVFVVPAPLFHAWGYTQLFLAAALTSTIVLSGPFQPRRTLEAVARHRATVLSVVPIMLQRMLPALDDGPVDLSTLRIVASSGSALPGPLAIRWMDATGDNLYNLYGSTEVGQVAIATPADLRAAPDTAGHPVAGVHVRLYDEDGNRLPRGDGIGRIAARSGITFDGYTGGGSKEVIDGHMVTGDVGRFDANGRLFVLGRDDDMIVSGGENVFPAEVEDLLATRPEVAEVAVFGVPDEEFGQRLVAHVVPAPGCTVDPEALRDVVRQRLARHKVPREVRVVETLPRNATGKLLRRSLSH
jgi:fatty-acyl-CoA synthase